MRGETFVTRKIPRALARIKLGLQERLYLGNLDAKRDWGHARDYVEMQWLMLQQPEAGDCVIATGVQKSVREFVEAAAGELGIGITWKGSGVDEKGYDASGNCIVAVDLRCFRPDEVEAFFAREQPDYVFLAAAMVGAYMPTISIRRSLFTRTWRSRPMLCMRRMSTK